MASTTQPNLPKGVRDFPPEVMYRRQQIFSTIRAVFEKFGFQPLETPSIELLSVLTGKYGDEGDQLLFRILRSGDFLAKTKAEDYEAGSRQMLSKIAEKGLRYDLTVPFARFVTKNRGQLTFPFKRYQMQPVWRADRPQKGRYQEFYQCDADVIGTESLLCEAEILAMMVEVLTQLRIPGFEIKVNHRKILAGLAETLGAAERESELFVVIDKLDKIGLDGVKSELTDRGFPQATLEKLPVFLTLEGSNEAKLSQLAHAFAGTQSGAMGLAEMSKILTLARQLGIPLDQVSYDLGLARGLSYYTGAIFEVKVAASSIGSISGGGRYADLTGTFGYHGLSGVGFSFGIDRIYDVMEEFDLFEQTQLTGTQVIIAAMDEAAFAYALPILSELRSAGIRTELYPESAKLKKQLNYADKKAISYALIVGSEEVNNDQITLKDLKTGIQSQISRRQIAKRLSELNVSATNGM